MPENDFLLRSSRALEIQRIPTKNQIRIKNRQRRTWAVFQDDGILRLLSYFATPRSYKQVLSDSDLVGRTDDRASLIKELLELGILQIELDVRPRNCPLCQNRISTAVATVKNPDFDDMFTYVRCNTCGSVYLNPSPSYDAQNAFYTYSNKYSDISLLRTTRWENGLRQKSNRLREQIILNAISLEKKTKVLDVGCGTGDFIIHLAKKYQCQAYGFDPDPKSISSINQTAPFVHTSVGGFENLDFGKTRFDIIMLWGVLEHLANPLYILRRSHTMLEAGGILLLDFPNLQGKTARWSLKNWPYLHPPFHLTHVDEGSLINAARNIGYDLHNRSGTRTGSFLLKYSDVILFLVNASRISYSSSQIDRIVSAISRPLILLENRFNFNSRTVLVFKLNSSFPKS